MRIVIDSVKGSVLLAKDDATPELIRATTFFSHTVADIIVNAAAAAYTVSIQHFERLFSVF